IVDPAAWPAPDDELILLARSAQQVEQIASKRTVRVVSVRFDALAPALFEELTREVFSQQVFGQETDACAFIVVRRSGNNLVDCTLEFLFRLGERWQLGGGSPASHVVIIIRAGIV